MSQDTPQPEHISKKELVYRIPGMDKVRVRRDVEFQTTQTGALTMESTISRLKAGRACPVGFVSGFPMPVRSQSRLPLQEMQSFNPGTFDGGLGLVASLYDSRHRNGHLALLRYVDKRPARARD